MSSITIVLPGESLALNPEGSGFAHGFGLFETIRLRAGKLELWEVHWSRLVRSAQTLNMVHSCRSEDALDAVRVLAGKLPQDATIKLSLLRERDGCRLYVYSRPLVPAPDRIGLLIEGPSPINESSLLAGHKTHNYLENMMVLDAAHVAGCYDALRLNSQGRVAEGAISNLFFFFGGAWHTPNLSSGLLPGVMREALLQILEVEQGEYLPEDVFSAEALFISNATIGLQPVDWLCSNGRKIGLSSRKHHCYKPVCRRLAESVEAGAIQF